MVGHIVHCSSFCNWNRQSIFIEIKIRAQNLQMSSGVKDVKKNKDQASGYTGKSIIDNYTRDKFNKATV